MIFVLLVFSMSALCMQKQQVDDVWERVIGSRQGVLLRDFYQSDVRGSSVTAQEGLSTWLGMHPELREEFAKQIGLDFNIQNRLFEGCPKLEVCQNQKPLWRLLTFLGISGIYHGYSFDMTNSVGAAQVGIKQAAAFRIKEKFISPSREVVSALLLVERLQVAGMDLRFIFSHTNRTVSGVESVVGLRDRSVLVILPIDWSSRNYWVSGGQYHDPNQVILQEGMIQLFNQIIKAEVVGKALRYPLEKSSGWLSVWKAVWGDAKSDDVVCPFVSQRSERLLKYLSDGLPIKDQGAHLSMAAMVADMATSIPIASAPMPKRFSNMVVQCVPHCQSQLLKDFIAQPYPPMDFNGHQRSIIILCQECQESWGGCMLTGLVGCWELLSTITRAMMSKDACEDCCALQRLVVDLALCPNFFTKPLDWHQNLCAFCIQSDSAVCSVISVKEGFVLVVPKPETVRCIRGVGAFVSLLTSIQYTKEWIEKGAILDEIPLLDQWCQEAAVDAHFRLETVGVKTMRSVESHV